MSLAERCDAITRLIDEALVPAATVSERHEGTELDRLAVLRETPQDLSCVVHATDGRWWQRPPDRPAGVRSVAA